MNSYPFLTSLFQTVLQQSETIGGRFFITYRNGRDINNDLLGQVLSEATVNIPTVKYPLAMMAPPVMAGALDKADGWVALRITLFFVRPSFIDSFNNIADINANTQTSNRPIVEDWSDMATVAVMFLRLLSQLMRFRDNSNYFRLDKNEQLITPVTTMALDKVSGVRLDFQASIFLGCQLLDYGDPTAFFNSLNLNSL